MKNKYTLLLTLKYNLTLPFNDKKNNFNTKSLSIIMERLLLLRIVLIKLRKAQ
jgi:hypothetical protein